MSIITPLLQQNEPTSCPMLIHKKSKVYQEISEKTTHIAFIGLQKESIAQLLRLGARYRVVGFDIHKNTIQELQQHRDPFQKIRINKNQLTFSVRNNVSVVYKYNDAEGIYVIHLARDFSATTSEFNVTYTKEIGNALKIDFVNHIPTSASKDAEVIERKPRVIIDTFQEE